MDCGSVVDSWGVFEGLDPEGGRTSEIFLEGTLRACLKSGFVDSWAMVMGLPEDLE